jgi:predicted RNase H-like nuclease
MMTAVGVDGCKTGWFFFRRDGEAITFGVAQSFQYLCESIPEHARIFIDIPIGLIDQGPSGRSCDVEARKLLGRGKGSSVFPAPCRPVLEARAYNEAKDLSFGAIGKKLSQQAFSITPKIKEVDEVLRNGHHNLSIREVHPEVCFWALNGRKALATKKKRIDGFEQRLELLSRFVPDARELVKQALDEFPRKEVARDDILDALVALVVACTSDASLQTVPASPPCDSEGLPMEIVYTEQPNLGFLKRTKTGTDLFPPSPLPPNQQHQSQRRQ